MRSLVTITSCAFAAFASMALAVPALAAVSPSRGVSSGGSCRAVHIPVVLASGASARSGLPSAGAATESFPAGNPAVPPNQTVWAELCIPFRSAPGRPLDVTVPGATYTHLYWDWPVDPERYNFTAKALRAGQAVLDYDRLGTGRSTTPPAADLTVRSDAAVLHQVIGWIRDNAGYADVNVIGHSLGSAIAVQEAGMWPGDPSRLVLTGFLNEMSRAEAAAVTADFYPASSDPLFPHAGVGYLTTIPGTRRSLFYSPSASLAVIVYDEAHKSVVAENEITTVASITALPGANISDKVRTPVLIVDGEDDALFCTGSLDCTDPASVIQFERRYFTDAASLIVQMVPDTGHDVALHPTADRSFALIRTWLQLTPAGGSRASGRSRRLGASAVQGSPNSEVCLAWPRMRDAQSRPRTRPSAALAYRHPDLGCGFSMGRGQMDAS